MGEAAPNQINPETGEIEETEENRPFVAFLNEIRHGGLVTELRDEMADLVKAVTAHEKAGTLTLTLKVTPAETEGVVTVADDLKVKAPKESKKPSLFFPDKKGDLSRTNPRQMQLGDGLREAQGH